MNTGQQKDLRINQEKDCEIKIFRTALINFNL